MVRLATVALLILALITVGLVMAQPPTSPPGVPVIPPDPTDRRTLTVIRSGTGSGTVSGPGITCGADCTEDYIVGTLTVIHAVPAAGSTFVGWSGACSGVGACTVPMTAAASVTATFTPVFHVLSVTKGGAGTGTVTSAPAGITCGADCSEPYPFATTVTLTPSASAGSVFANWSGACTGSGTCQVTMTEPRAVTATFNVAATVALTVTTAGTGSGTVTSTPAGINCGADCTENYAPDTSVTLSQTASGGSTFAGWSGACTGTGACVVIMSQARAVTATFTLAPIAGCTPGLTSTGTLADTQAKITAANPGNVVCIPAGNFSWNGLLTINKPITVRGAGKTATHITNNFTTGNMIQITEQTGGVTRLEGIDFIVGSGPAGGSTCGGTTCRHITISYTSGGRPVLILNNRFAALGGLTSGDAIGINSNRGVISGNDFSGVVGGTSCDNTISAVRQKSPQLDSTWNTLATWGTADTTGELNLYIETNTFNDLNQGLDNDDAARTIVRNNTNTNSHWGMHGSDTTQNSGSRYMVVANNTFVWDSSSKGCGGSGTAPSGMPNGFFWTRGGTFLMHHNTIPNINSSAWGNKPEVILKYDTIRRPGGSWGCWNQGYPGPHQTGWGWRGGLTQAGTSGVFQDQEPIYIWGNQGAGNYNSPSLNQPADQCGNGTLLSTYIQLNRDYYVFSSAVGTPQTTGVREGLLSARPIQCSGSGTTKVAYWATDTNTLYRCSPDNTWTAIYTPAPYPHPLVVTP